MDRRRFLQPARLAEAAGQALALADELTDLAPASPTPAEVGERAFVRLGWRAMATAFEMLLPLDTPEGVQAGRDGFEFLDTLEDQLTVYREQSEVARLNRQASQRAIRVEAGLFDLLDLAGRVTTETDGAYDIAIGTLIKAWGFFRGPCRVPADSEIADALARGGMANILLDHGRRTVRYLRPGLEINLGSIGKGYALDRVADHLLCNWGVRHALLHGGASSVIARGDAHADGRGWAVRLRHPIHPATHLAEVRLQDQALGTSAATFQHLEHEGRQLGHILDPRTGWPASGLASVSVIAPTGALADALSTAFYVGGIDLARRYCSTHPEVGAVLLPDGAASPTVFGMKPGTYTLLMRPR